MEIEDFGKSSGSTEPANVQFGSVHNLATDQPAQIQKQSWNGVYVDWAQQPIHILLHDAYYGCGGFAGNISAGDGIGNKTVGAYSYVTPSSTELQYLNRAKMVIYANYFARYVNSTVYPVFSASQVNLISKNEDGSVRENDKDAQAFFKDCSGTGTSYTAMQTLALEQLRTHGVCYYTMTVPEGKKMPVLGLYRAIDIIYVASDGYGVMKDVMVYRGDRYCKEKRKTYVKAVRFYMEDGYCWIQQLEAECEGYSLGSYPDVSEFEPIDDESENPIPPARTDSQEMLFYAQLPTAEPTGIFIPEYPKSRGILNCCMAIYQNESKFNWLYTLLNLPISCFYGNIEGVNIGAGNVLISKSQSIDGNYPPAAHYMEITSDSIAQSMAWVMQGVERLREIAKENGVDSRTGAQAQSGDSKSYDFQATETKLQESVEWCKTMNEWVFGKFNFFLNRSGVYHLTYPESFYPEEEPALAEYETAFNIARDSGATILTAEILKKYGAAILGKTVSSETISQIVAEIDSLQVQRQTTAM